jgi:hypothetical protein
MTSLTDKLSDRRYRVACEKAAAKPLDETVTVGEFLDRIFGTMPEPSDYGRAWYLQCPERSHYEALPWTELLNMITSDDPEEGKFVFLEAARRAREAGYRRTGDWFREQFGV